MQIELYAEFAPEPDYSSSAREGDESDADDGFAELQRGERGLLLPAGDDREIQSFDSDFLRFLRTINDPPLQFALE
eukprot:8656218-Prorocentrum_lima.AAC.1